MGTSLESDMDMVRTLQSRQTAAFHFGAASIPRFFLLLHILGTVTASGALLALPEGPRFLTSPDALGLSNGTFRLRISGIDTSQPTALVIEASTNLVAWRGIYTNPFPSTSQMVLDLTASNQVRRFYRAKTLLVIRSALATPGAINLNGNSIATDSFDSTDPFYSGPGGAYDPSKHKANGDIAAYWGITNSVSVGNAEILGHVLTGPGAAVSIGANGIVGDLNWTADGHVGVQPGYVRDDMNMTFPNAPIPPAGGTSMGPGGTVNGVTYNNILGNGNFEVASLNLSGNQKVLVTGTNTRLYVTGNVSLAGNALINLAPGGKLTLYVGGTSANIGGNGVLNPGSSANFIYYGLANNTSLDIHANAAFTGVIYAPQADLSLGGGGSNTYDLVGAACAKAISLNGHWNFHYDEALARFGLLP
jgi:hypothetical protein